MYYVFTHWTHNNHSSYLQLFVISYKWDQRGWVFLQGHTESKQQSLRKWSEQRLSLWTWKCNIFLLPIFTVSFFIVPVDLHPLKSRHSLLHSKGTICKKEGGNSCVQKISDLEKSGCWPASWNRAWGLWALGGLTFRITILSSQE